jgi:two-component system, NtrC family, C4-dicarboxylate transport sensor histidine kinase DctB
LRVQERTRELERAYGNLRHETEERISAMESLRRNEQLLMQQSRLAAMGEMLGNIAHQWRQPLNNLGLILQHLPLDLEIGELTQQNLEAVVAKAMQLILHMSHTIDDFSTFLQPDKERAEFALNDVVTTTISLFEATLRTMNVEVEVREKERLIVQGRRNEFSQVLMNLITNARDAFKERGVRSPKLVIELFREEGKAVVTISDNAGGIPDMVIDRIFEPYFTTKGPDKGTGIGLFMSKNIIEKSMNGTLSVRNTGDGAEFRIEV